MTREWLTRTSVSRAGWPVVLGQLFFAASVMLIA
jgi:hypothetical protein